MKLILALLFIVSCSTSQIKTPVEVLEPVVVTPTNLETPEFISNRTLPVSYVEAMLLIKKWANSDEFANYMKNKRKYFSHTDLKVSDAVELFRSQLNKKETVKIEFYKNIFSSSIGGWTGYVIKQNTRFNLSAVERAGHLLHEVSHKYGWKHEGNYKDKNDNINSFPYAVGIDLEEFLKGLK